MLQRPIANEPAAAGGLEVGDLGAGRLEAGGLGAGGLLERALRLVVGLLLALASATADARGDLDQLDPLPRGPLGAAARAALQRNDYAQAVRLLQRYLRARGAAREEREPAHFLLAYAHLQQGQHTAAAREFERLERSYPLLRPYHRYYGALARYRAGRFAAAERLADSVARDTGADRDARLLRADALRALGRLNEAAAIWRAYLASTPHGARSEEAHFVLAGALETEARQQRPADRPALLRQAMLHYRELLLRAPTSRLADTARQRLAALAPGVADGVALATLDAEARYQQGLALYNTMRNAEAEQRFGEVLGSQGLAGPLACRASYHRAKAVLRQRQRARASTLFADAAARCRSGGDQELLVRSLYNLGRALAGSGEPAAGAAELLALEQQFPHHSYADDARLQAARALAEADQRQRADTLLSSLPSAYPRGDMAHEALWLLALDAMARGDQAAALQALERELALGPASAYFARGRATYWKARLLQRAGDAPAAERLLERCAREQPLAYYALLALNRLRELAPARFRRLEAELLRPIGQGAGPWRLGHEPWRDRPAFHRALVLARLGFAPAAGRELVLAGVRSASEARQPQWVEALVFDRVGLWHLSLGLAKRRVAELAQSYPRGPAYHHWQLVFPRAFRPLVEAEARRAGVPTALIWAVMREESAFVAATESWANAIGLLQLLLSTARAVAAREHLRVDAERLREPATNIRLGAAYLATLRGLFGGHAALAVASYNAGDGAVRRWLRQWGATLYLDELVERIPYEQTRDYTKRVLGSLFAYAALYGHPGERVPLLPLRLAAGAGPASAQPEGAQG
ncbi:MAG: transglycosylase SLT domain-containing protein [Proteobacteria bacterium]|nr:transglycosylase SLT domain-containing protein [Pseudomonadota bacterium]